MKTKDPNHLAAVEKAIAEKYGKDTVQDFRSEWESLREEEYLAQLSAARNKKDLLKQNKLSRRKLNRTCPVCKTYSFSSSDDLYMNRFKCCKICYDEFIDCNEEKWNSGWRPSEQQINLAIRRRK
tara:strand:+ start:3754 stop:4128 length:375 start_codon:yes stop_codon:yes gene_type:complete